eukprot:scaffold426_cov219-Amphora_coffeaeformis.AAC.32
MKPFTHSVHFSLAVLVLLCDGVAHAWLTPTRPSSPTARWKTTTSSSSPSSSSALYHRKKTSGDENESQALIRKESVRFLGRGENAVVRPGCVLVAPKHEFHTFYRRSAILIYAMGEAEDGSGDYLIRGLILDNPTPFTLKEMMDHQPHVVENPLGENFLFRGGDKGGDGVILLHAWDDLERPQIGMSGLYEGGWQQALEICQNDVGSTDTFKAFFNYCEFSEKELEDLLDSVEDGDAWVSLEVPPTFCLNPDFDRGDAWSLLRNAVQQMEVSEQ